MDSWSFTVCIESYFIITLIRTYIIDYLTKYFAYFQARDVYEEAIQTVTTVRDFTQVFDAYAQFEELSLSKVMELTGSKANPTEEGTFII